MVGAHHLLAYVARHGWGITSEEAWRDASDPVRLVPPDPFFGLSSHVSEISDEINRAMLAYIAGDDDCEFQDRLTRRLMGARS